MVERQGADAQRCGNPDAQELTLRSPEARKPKGASIREIMKNIREKTVRNTSAIVGSFYNTFMEITREHIGKLWETYGKILRHLFVFRWLFCGKLV